VKNAMPKNHIEIRGSGHHIEYGAFCFTQWRPSPDQTRSRPARPKPLVRIVGLSPAGEERRVWPAAGLLRLAPCPWQNRRWVDLPEARSLAVQWPFARGSACPRVRNLRKVCWLLTHVSPKCALRNGDRHMRDMGDADCGRRCSARAYPLCRTKRNRISKQQSWPARLTFARRHPTTHHTAVGLRAAVATICALPEIEEHLHGIMPVRAKTAVHFFLSGWVKPSSKRQQRGRHRTTVIGGCRFTGGLVWCQRPCPRVGTLTLSRPRLRSTDRARTEPRLRGFVQRICG